MDLAIIDQEMVDLINSRADFAARRAGVDPDDVACRMTDCVIGLVRRGKDRLDIVKMIKRISWFAVNKARRSRLGGKVKRIEFSQIGDSELDSVVEDNLAQSRSTPENKRLSLIRKHVGKFGYLLAIGCSSREAAIRCNQRPTKSVITRLRRETREKIEQLEQQGLYLHENDWADYAI